MKTVETKISKSGATIYYVDGKRTSRENAMFIQRMNEREARRLAKIEAEKAALDAAVEGEIESAMVNSNCETAKTGSDEVSENAEVSETVKFKVGKTYAAKKSVLFDSQCTLTVINRTNCYVTFQFDEDEEDIRRCKIVDDAGVEKIYIHETNAISGDYEFSAKDVANDSDEVTENNVETTDTASSMVIEVKTFDSGRFTVKLNGKKIALKVLEQAPYYDSADLDAVIIFNGRKFRNVGDIKVVTDYYNVFADENGYGFFVSGISGDIWNLGKGMTSIRDMSNEIAQIEAKRKASEEMWNAIKTDPLNALDTDQYAVTEDAFNFAVEYEIEEAEYAAAESRAIARILGNETLKIRYEKAKSQVKCKRYENGYCGWYFKGKHADDWEHDGTKAAACLVCSRVSPCRRESEATDGNTANTAVKNFSTGIDKYPPRSATIVTERR